MEINSAAAAKPAGMPLGLGLLIETLEVSAREQSENLTEHGAASIDVAPPVFGVAG